MSDAINKLNKIEYEAFYRELNEQFVRAWNFLVSETMRLTAGYCVGEPVLAWQTPMFVMDIDDVLDKNIFGFPSTTEHGIRAISLLRAHRVCSAINTARSLKEVQNYCRHYSFAGGIAEYGSVIWDAIEQETRVLVSEPALAELAALREALGRVSGVFTNPSYLFSIRAYSYDRQKTIPIPEATIGDLFRRLDIQHLKAHRTYIDTAVLDKAVDKGNAMLRLKDWKGINHGEVGAVGDSETDLPMLKVADRGFLVSNSDIELKRQARQFGIRIVKSRFQAGLHEAANVFVHGREGPGHEPNAALGKKLKHEQDPMREVIRIADYDAVRLWPRLIDRDILEIFQE